MLYQLSYFRKNRPYQSYPFPHTVSRRRRACNSNRHSFLWEVMDSNHRRRTPADLQSAPFGHSGNFPCFAPLPRGIRFARLSRRNWLVSLGCASFHFADPALGRLSFYRRPVAASLTSAFRADGGIRTPDQLITNQLLWPTELHRQNQPFWIAKVGIKNLPAK